VAQGDVSGDGSGSQLIGGLIGYRRDGTVERARATGRVSGQDFVGGLIGIAEGGPLATTVRRTSATGDVSGDVYIGGLIGIGLQEESSRVRPPVASAVG